MGAVSSSPKVATAASWPDADALFRSDPRWRGSDDAYSVELSPGRTLWLFGDTFVDGATRAEAAFIRNSVGIQAGTDPSAASIELAWKPGAFFDAPEGTWYWPLDGGLAGDALVLFMMHVRSPGGGDGAIDEWRRLGPFGFFDVFGWAALAVSNPGDHPSHWDVRPLAHRTDPAVLGAAVVPDGDFTLAYGWNDAKQLLLARWPAESVAVGEPEWWTGSSWERGGTPAVVIERGATEFSVHQDATRGYVQVQTIVEEQALAVRRAERPQGPWTEPEIVFRPEETQRPGVFVYAGKAHPHLHGADLVATYASNADVDVCLADESLYYPRFVRLTIDAP